MTVSERLSLQQVPNLRKLARVKVLFAPCGNSVLVKYHEQHYSQCNP